MSAIVQNRFKCVNSATDKTIKTWHIVIMPGFYDSIMNILKRESQRHGSQRKLAEAAGVIPTTLSRWLRQDRAAISLSELSVVLDYLGVKPYYPGDIKDKEYNIIEMEEKIDRLQEELNQAKEEELLLRGEIRSLERRLDRHENAEFGHDRDEQGTATG